MTALIASAPGKLFVCGEYAVLDGAPAVVVAVDRRAVVRVAAADRWIATAPGFDRRAREFSVVASRLEWPQGDSPLPVLDAVFAALPCAGDGPLALTLDTASFAAAGGKLGLGSSAALVVAACGALMHWFTGSCKDLLTTAVSAHRALQGGRGSGVDVAMAARGGFVCCHRLDQAVDLAWPDGLHARVLYCGVPASTSAKLKRLAAADRDPSRRALAAAAVSAAGAWRSADCDAVLAAMAAFTASLAAFSRAHGLDVFAHGHERLRTLAQSRGLVYKPCGAGGGDAGMVLGRDPEALAAFVQAAVGIGFRDLSLNVAAAGKSLGFTAAWTQD